MRISQRQKSCLAATGAFESNTSSIRILVVDVVTSYGIYGTFFCLEKGFQQRYSQTVRPPGPTSTLESMDVASKSRGRGVRWCHAAFVDAADGDGIIETWIILNGDKLRNLPRGEPLNLHNI